MSLREAVRIVTDNPRKYNDRIRAAHERLRRFLEKRA